MITKRTRTVYCPLMILLALLAVEAFANTAPQVSNVRAAQRSDDSKLVDITYDLADGDGDACTVWMAVSDNGGATWNVPVDKFIGVGPNITPGTNKAILWDAGLDMPGKSGTFKIRVWADDGNGPDAMVVVPAGSFAYQGDYSNRVNLGVFMIDKYETTVQQYCQFLNADDPAGAYWHSGQEIVRKGNSGNYYYEVQSGRENYPVRYVSMNDAVAYAAWKSVETGLNYRLPTEQEWEKAAGWDPVQQHHYTYGFHRDNISCTYCNYSICVGSPTQVGSYDPYKSYYGCYDMSGNVCEWTSGGSSSSRVIRGGYWYSNATGVAVASRDSSSTPTPRYSSIGFRLVLDLN